MSVPDGWIDPDPWDPREEDEERASITREEELEELELLASRDAAAERGDLGLMGAGAEEPAEEPAWHENLVAPDDLAWVEIP